MNRYVRRGAAASVLAVVALLPATPARACSACGCTLTSDWIGEGFGARQGVRLDLRYDYIPQTVLRSSAGRIPPGSIALPTDREIETYTYNSYITAGLDWSPSRNFAVNMQLPFVIRPHATYAEGDIEQSHSDTQGIGDIRLSARYQGFGGPGISGVQLGLKLPSGGFHTRFDAGPQAGVLVDRGLQAGTGTTDLLAGLYHFGNLAGKFDWFVQAIAVIPLNNREDYLPGTTGLGSLGLHYTGWQGITPQLQFNLRIAGQDKGVNSDRDNSGGELLYISPGVSAKLSNRVSAFGFVQAPLYERVIGYQLVPKFTISAGLQFWL